MHTTHTFNASDGTSIFYYKWASQADVPQRGVIQLAHGLGEHAGRYAPFANFLQGAGYTVYANDHRAHGQTAGPALLGKYEGKNFWEDAIQDMRTFNQLIEKEHPSQPIILIGHSMGSLLSRHYISKYGNNLSAALISGTAPFIKILGAVGISLATIIQWIYGRKSDSPFLKSLFFDEFNKQFKPTRTNMDWISRDEKEVDKFVADPLRTDDFQIGFFLDMLKGFRATNRKAVFEATPTDLPMYLFSGDKDPVGENGKGVERVYEDYKKAGVKNISLKLYPDGRHEMLTEINKAAVFQDVLMWIENHVPVSKSSKSSEKVTN